METLGIDIWMMKPVTTKAEMLTLSRKTEQWKFRIQYVIKVSLKPRLHECKGTRVFDRRSYQSTDKDSKYYLFWLMGRRVYLPQHLDNQFYWYVFETVSTWTFKRIATNMSGGITEIFSVIILWSWRLHPEKKGCFFLSWTNPFCHKCNVN